MSRLPILRYAGRIVCGFGALVALATFASAAWYDRTATATTAAGLCLALAILAALDLESFEGLGIKAKLKSTLTDAERRLDSLDQMTRVLANGAFLNIARGLVSAEEQRDTVAAMTRALRDLGMSVEEVDRIKRPFYGYVASSIWAIFTYARADYAVHHANAIQAQLAQIPISGDPRELQERLSALYTHQPKSLPTPDHYEDLRTHLAHWAEELPVINAEDRLALRAVASELSDLLDACVREGNLAPRVVEVLGEIAEGREASYRTDLAARLIGNATGIPALPRISVSIGSNR